MTLYTDALDGPSNALGDFFMPTYQQAMLTAGVSQDNAITQALMNYNGGPNGYKKKQSQAYARRVIKLWKGKYSGGLWDIVPQ